MDAGSQVGELQKLVDRLCQETDPGKIYKMLKKMSSMPILCDSLAQIGFRQTIECLKKQQLLVPFVKDLVAKWSTGSQPGPQREQIKQDLGLVMSLPKEHQSNSPEEEPQAWCASQEARGAGREVFLGFSSLGPGRISGLKPNADSHPRSDPRAPQSRSLDPGENWSPEQQLPGQNQVRVECPTASLEEPRQGQGAKSLSRKPGAGPGKHKWPVFEGHRKSQPPGHSEQEESAGAGSFGSGLHDEWCSPSSSVLPPSKKKRELPGLAELQRPPAKLPRGESRSSKDPSPIAAWAIPESPTTGQDSFSWDVVQEPSHSQQDQEPLSAWEWAIRKNHKARVYSGFRPAADLQQKSDLGLLADEHAGTRDAAGGQAAKVEAQPEPGQPEENSWPETQTCQQTHRGPESPTRLQLQESQEKRLQGLRARMQSTRAKSLQARQTRMISFHTQLKSPALQPEPGARGAASAPNSHSLPEASAHAGAQRASSLLSGERGNKKAPAKRPAPLMAKAIRDYRHRYSKK